MNDLLTYGIPDSDFIRGNIPMTKEEVRCITLSKLRLCENDCTIDIGSGTGSITVELARLLKNKVYSVEFNPDAIELIKSNCRKFNVDNVEILEGMAPENLNEISDVDKVVIGGSKGKLPEIIKWVKEKMNINGRIVINANTLDTLYNSKKLLLENDFKELEIIQVSINKFQETGNTSILKSFYPVFIISASKEL